MAPQENSSQSSSRSSVDTHAEHGLPGKSLMGRGSLFERFRRHFLAGLLVLVPAFIAGYAVVLLMNGADAIFGQFIDLTFGYLFDRLKVPPYILHLMKTLLAFVLAALLVISVGYFSTFFVVKRLIHFGENLVGRVPLIKFFYNTPKEVITTFTMTRKNSFKRVVMVEYPRKGMWCFAFATGELRRRPDNSDLVAIFLPTTPNPTSGFLIYLTFDQVLDTNISVEQGARMIISGGILSPEEIITQKFLGIDIEPNLPPIGPMTTEEQKVAGGLPNNVSRETPEEPS